MKSLLRTALQKAARIAVGPLAKEWRHELAEGRRRVATRMLQSTERVGQAAQVALLQHYRDMARRGEPPPSWAEVGFRCRSQFEEDGILLCLFGLIGATNRVAVELCAGDGLQCNTANLIINHGWWGYLFDGDAGRVARGVEFYRTHPDTFLYPPRFECAWIAAETVNDDLRRIGVEGPVDLLSLDLDGMDYWIWDAIAAIQPRVVVCETQNVIPPHLALTVPYARDFVAMTPDFHGASLAAMAKLAARKGYRLVGTHKYGFNAFFVQRGIGEGLLPEVSVQSCGLDPYTQEARRTRWPKVKDLGWVEV